MRANIQRQIHRIIGGQIYIDILLNFFLVVAMFGMLSPASRGSLLSAVVFLFVFMG